MKHIKLFEQFINEAKANPRSFANMFSDAVDSIHKYATGFGIQDELSKENLLFVLMKAWDEVCNQNNFTRSGMDYEGKLRYALQKFKINTEAKIGILDISEKAVEFGANAYGETGYHLEGMVDCFCHVLEDQGLVKKPLVKKIKKFLLA